MHVEKKDSLYRVQIGSFPDKETAESVLQQVYPVCSDAYLIRSFPSDLLRKNEPLKEGYPTCRTYLQKDRSLAWTPKG